MVQLAPQLAVELLSLQTGAAAVPPQLRKPSSHWMPQVPLAEQTGCECEPAPCAGQSVQASPQEVAPWVTHTLLHLCWLAPHVVSHTPAIQVDEAGHGLQSRLSSVPQVALALFETQTPLHRWFPALQCATQRVPLQVLVPIASAVQGPQVLPQDDALVLSSAMQTRLPSVPQAWKVELQFTSHVVPVQAAAPLAGAAQAEHPLAEQPDSGLLFRTQRVGPVPGQPWNPVAQVTLQVVPMQTAEPEVGVGQALQPVALQPEATLLSATHVPPQRCMLTAHPPPAPPEPAAPAEPPAPLAPA
jgi:hypothetical protein